MNNTLLISKKLDFSHLMRIAEGMSYNHDEVVIKARGKQIQRAGEVAVMLKSRGRGTVGLTEYGVEEGDMHIPNIEIHVTVYS